MLENLHIENVAVVRTADIALDTGFTVLTGETGAGKSIIIDSINLLLGARPQRELLRHGASGAAASGMFRHLPQETAAAMAEAGVRMEEDGTFLLQRTITADGKASARINGRPITVSTQRMLAAQLISIHGQHDNQRFLNPETHITYLDAYAGLSSLLALYTERYTAFTEIRSKIRSLQKDEQEKARMAELLKYQIADIDAGRLKSGEEDALLEKRQKIRNLEKISKQVRIVYHALYRSEKSYSAAEQMERAIAALDQMADIFPKAAEYSEKLSEFRYELEDIAETVQAYADDTDGDPTVMLDKIETRLETIAKLRKKYGVTVEDVLAYREKIAEELEDITLSDEKIADLQKSLQTAREALAETAKDLTERRRAAGKQLSESILAELRFLDMEKVRFAVEVRAYRPIAEDDSIFTPNGCDAVEFMISTNPGEPLKPLDKIASGGELSRIMLAAKCVMAHTDHVQTMIFDEVDTGVSGKTSQKIGMKLKSLAKSGCQVLCVTHSAQIAALADQHLFISKHEIDGRTETSVQQLDEEGRVAELSRIIGGIEITDTVRETAKELLRQGKLL